MCLPALVVVTDTIHLSDAGVDPVVDECIALVKDKYPDMDMKDLQFFHANGRTYIYLKGAQPA